MAKVTVIDIPLTREHAQIALKALRVYLSDGTNRYDYAGDKVVNEEIEYFEAIIKFYDAAEVLNNG